MRQFIKKILAILNRDERTRMGMLIVFDLLTGALDIAFLGGLLVLINYFTSGAKAPHFSIVNSTIGSNPLWFTGIFLLLYGVKNFLGYYISAKGDAFFYKVASRLSRRNLLQYLRNGYSNFVHIGSSVYIRGISQQPIEFSAYILTNIQQVVTQSILVLFAVAAILFYHPTLFILLFGILVPPVFMLGYFIKKRLSRIRSNIKTTGEKSIQHLQEALTGYVESNIYDKNDFFTDRYHQYQTRLNENIATQQSLQTLPPRLIEVFAILGFFMLIVIGRVYGNGNTVSLLNVGVFMAAAYKIIPGIVKILNSLGQMKTYRFVIDDLLTGQEVLADEQVKETVQLTSIEFKDVCFNYGDRNILNDISFQILPGDIVSLCGESGRGKTTIVNLLLGFLTENEGGIYLNGAKTAAIERENYLNRVSYVKQQPFLINDTILKNITLSDSEYHSGRLAKAMAICGLYTILKQYPEGQDKQVTENGKNLSGGQRQRIALARALYHDFDLLILDEPFSELDEESTKNILQQLVKLAENGKMILFITHSKESLVYSSRIISFNAVYEA